MVTFHGLKRLLRVKRNQTSEDRSWWKFVHINIDIKLAPWLAILVLLASTAIDFVQQVVRGFVGSDGIEPYAIVILIFSLAYICISLDQSGLLSYIANYATKRWGSNGRLLLMCHYILSTIMAVLTSNDVVVLVLTPITCIFSDITGVDAEPFLIAMFVAANTASMCLYIGNPTNIVASQANGVSFLQYTAWMALPFLGAAVGGALVMYVLCVKKVPKEIAVDLDINPKEHLTRPRQAILGAVVLSGCLIALSVSSLFGAAVWLVTLPFGGAMLLVDTAVDLYSTRQKIVISPAPTLDVEMSRLQSFIAKTHRRLPTVSAVIERLPYNIVPFSVGMFILVESLSATGWTPRLAWLLKHICPSVVPAVFAVGVVTSLACNILNNLPMTILFTRALKHAVFAEAVNYTTRRGALFALIIGSNLGANFTLVGSLAGLMFQGIARQRKRDIGYLQFFLWCLPVLPIQLGISCGILSAEMIIMK